MKRWMLGGVGCALALGAASAWAQGHGQHHLQRADDLVPGGGRRVHQGNRDHGRRSAEERRRSDGAGRRRARQSQARRVLHRHRRPAPAGGGDGAHRGIQVADAAAAPRLGDDARPKQSKYPDGRRLQRRARHRLQHRASREEEAAASRSAGPISPIPIYQGRDPDGESERLGHRVRDARDVRPDLRRGQGVRAPEGRCTRTRTATRARASGSIRAGRARRDRRSPSRSCTTA